MWLNLHLTSPQMFCKSHKHVCILFIIILWFNMNKLLNVLIVGKIGINLLLQIIWPLVASGIQHCLTIRSGSIASYVTACLYYFGNTVNSFLFLDTSCTCISKVKLIESQIYFQLIQIGFNADLRKTMKSKILMKLIP